MKKEEREAKLRLKFAEMRRFELELWESEVQYIAGVDEVGRGPLAGPVVAAAVILPQEFDTVGIDDSKKLSEKKREYFYEIITEQSLAYGLGMIENAMIDEINILEATKLAMSEAIKNADEMLMEQHNARVEHILIDAVKLETEVPSTSIIKGDASCISIAAASIIAKVARDRIMCDYGELYPHYSFDSNKGYGTKAHYEGIAEAGICPIHRKTFLKGWYNE